MITPYQLRKCAMCVYLAADEGPAEDISNHLIQAAERIESLEQFKAKALLILEAVKSGDVTQSGSPAYLKQYWINQTAKRLAEGREG